MNQYDIVKAIFLTDVSHINRYGRPITFDNYVAMKDGPGHFVVKDATGFSLCYVYARKDEALRRSYMTHAEAVVSRSRIMGYDSMKGHQ